MIKNKNILGLWSYGISSGLKKIWVKKYKGLQYVSDVISPWNNEHNFIQT